MAMIPTLFFYAFLLVARVWLFLMLYWLWPHNPDARFQALPTPQPPRHKRSREPKPFVGLSHKPPCALCEQEAASPTSPSPLPPTPMPSPHRRPRSVDASMHFCPHPGCDYRGWVGLGKLRANGHPNGGPWRQFHCTACAGYFLETHGTIFHGKRVDPQKVMWAVTALAEGLSIRAMARVFEVNPNTVFASR
jgi:hypothetical protein